MGEFETKTSLARTAPKEYVVRDTEVPGLGIRVYASGRKLFFAQMQIQGRRKQQSLGTVDRCSLAGARELALACTADSAGMVPTLPNVLFEEAAGRVLENYRRNWKSTTAKASFKAYENDILPFFEGMKIGDIDRSHVVRWFASLGNRPYAANRALPVLSVIMQQAEVYGYRPDNSNPAKGHSRYKRPSKERFLSKPELARLGKTLIKYREKHPHIVLFLHLMILTGCRKGEIAGLKWSSYKHGNLYLPDSKTGPKTVYLSVAARAVLDIIPRTSSFVFSGLKQRNGGRITSGITQGMIDPHWRKIRKLARIADVRMHDLRYTYASIALANGEHILTIGRLLGHKDPETTLKYAHLANEQIQSTARAVSVAIGGEM